MTDEASSGGSLERLFGTFDRDTISLRIARRIMSLIKDKHLKPGDRLPSERDLAKMMGVSRSSLREALRALQIMNIIENRQGSGNYVASLEPGKLIEHLDAVFLLDDSTFLELFVARKVVETGITELAAERITDEEIVRLKRIVDEARDRVGDIESFLRLDMELHGVITKASGNSILEMFMSFIDRLSTYSRRRTAESEQVRRRTVKDHQRIVKALESRNPAGAREAMFRHLSNVENGLLALGRTEG